MKAESVVCTTIVPEHNVPNMPKLGSSEEQMLHTGENVAKRGERMELMPLVPKYVRGFFLDE